MVQPGSSCVSSASCSWVMDMPLTLRRMRLSSPYSGVKSVIGLESRYRVRRPRIPASGDISLMRLPLRFRVVRPPRAVSCEISVMELSAMERLLSARRRTTLSRSASRRPALSATRPLLSSWYFSPAISTSSASCCARRSDSSSSMRADICASCVSILRSSSSALSILPWRS